MASAAQTGYLGEFPRHDLIGSFDSFGAQNTEAAKFSRIAPRIQVSTRRSVLSRPTAKPILNEVGPDSPLLAKGLDAAPSAGRVTFGDVNVDVDLFRFGDVQITNEAASESAAQGISSESAWMQVYAPQAAALYGREIGIALGTDANFDSSLIASSENWTPANTDIVGKVRAALKAMRNLGTSTMSDMIAVCNWDVATNLMNLAHVQRGTSVAVGSNAGTAANFQRTDAISEEDLVAWFKAKLKLDLFIIETVTDRAAGTLNVLDDDFYILKSSPDGFGPSFLKTAALDSWGGSLGVPMDYPCYKPAGRGLYYQMALDIVPYAPWLGYKFKGVLS